MPVESSSLVPMLIAARQAGINVLVAGGNPDNRNAYTAVMLTNQFLAGSFEAWMAKQWIDETYPNASEGSIETAILESTLNADAVDRSAGMKMLIQPFLKNAKGEFVDATGIVVTEANKVANPAYTLKVKVVQIAQAEMFQAGRTAMQDILITNPKVKVVLAYTGDAAMGASQAILDEFARGSGVSAIGELSKVAVFGVGMTGLEGAAILDSASNKTVFRGTIRIGGDVVGRTMEYVKLMLTTETEGILYDPLEVVTVVGGKLMALPVVQNKFFTVPDGQPIEIKLDPPLG
jgi:ABC-type sugar transport system substrate-binding protein